MNLSSQLTRGELVELLGLNDFSPVFAEADRVRYETVGNKVHIRGLLEFSNYCRRRCLYCGLNASNSTASRYRMSPEEICSVARSGVQAGYKTLVLQSGEDPWFTAEILAEIVRDIKQTGVDITLSCGELPHEDYKILREAGADRYLLKHETSDELIYSRLHPCGTLKNRLSCLRSLKSLGFETGSGFMIGLPGQTLETIADDLLLLQSIPCEMAGIGPFIPHPDTPLKDQTQGSLELTKRAVALARILLPAANLPATTSLGVLDKDEKDLIFSCGANVIMEKITPLQYRAQYEIYPGNVGSDEILAGRQHVEESIRRLGKIPV